MSRRNVRPVTSAQIERMSVARLDAYRRRLLSLESDIAGSDIQTEAELETLDPDLIYFKSDRRWADLHAAVLAARALRRRTS